MSSTALQTPGLLTQLRSEWLRTGTETIVLGDAEYTADELLTRLHALTGPAQDELLHQLLVAGHEGNLLAERIVLQRLLPKAVHLARSCASLRDIKGRDNTSQDAVAIAIGAVWEEIRVYPLHLTSSIHANIGLNALNKITKITAGESVILEPEIIQESVESTQAIKHTDEWDPESWATDNARAVEDLAFVLRWAIDTQTLSPAEVRLLARYDLGSLEDREDLADELDIKRDSLNRRAHRIRCTLVEAIQTHIRENGGW